MDDFLGQCMVALKDKFPDEEQRLAVCFAKREQGEPAACSTAPAGEELASARKFLATYAGGTSPRDSAIILRREGENKAPFAPIGEPKAHKFLKDMAHVGRYTHPTEGWTLDITPERMDRWAAAFSKMKANGCRVNIPVDHSFRAEANRGYVTDMFRAGNTLYGVHELPDEASVSLARRCPEVSIWVEPDFSDSQNHYGEAIVHSSIVQQPIVTNQSGFMPMAASAATRLHRAHLYVMSRQEETAMDMVAFLAQLAQLLGVGPDKALTPEMAIAALRAKLGGEAPVVAKPPVVAAAAPVAEAKPPVVVAPEVVAETPEEKAKRLKEEADKAAAQATATAQLRADGCGLSAAAVEDLAEGAEALLEACAAKGAVDPETAKALGALLVGAKGKRRGFALSSRFSGGESSIAVSVLRVLAGNKPRAFSARTGAQIIPSGDDAIKAHNDQVAAITQIALGATSTVKK